MPKPLISKAAPPSDEVVILLSIEQLEGLVADIKRKQGAQCPDYTVGIFKTRILPASNACRLPQVYSILKLQ